MYILFHYQYNQHFVGWGFFESLLIYVYILKNLQLDIRLYI